MRCNLTPEEFKNVLAFIKGLNNQHINAEFNKIFSEDGNVLGIIGAKDPIDKSYIIYVPPGIFIKFLKVLTKHVDTIASLFKGQIGITNASKYLASAKNLLADIKKIKKE